MVGGEVYMNLCIMIDIGGMWQAGVYSLFKCPYETLY